MTHCGRSGMSDYIRMVHIKNEHSCHGHYSHGCSNIWSHCCGGGTSFMGGVGAGLAYSLVNWAMSGLTNWIGGMGFGGGNWFGGMGWGNVGFGGGNNGFWGLNGANGRDGADGSRSTKGDYYSRRYGSSDRTSGSEGANGANGVKDAKSKDTDEAKLADILKNAKAHIATKDSVDTSDESKVNEYNNELDRYINQLKNYNYDGYDDLKNQKTNENALSIIDKPENRLIYQKIPVALTDTQVEINGNPVEIDGNLNKATVNSWPEADVRKIDQTKAKQILEKLGLLNNDGTAKMSIDYNVLILLEKSGLNVQCATNPRTNGDKYIKGKISNVIKDSNGKLSYDIDCKDVPFAAYGYKYSFKQQDDNNKFKLTEIAYNNSGNDGWIHQDWNTRDYTFSNDILTINGDPQVSANEGNGRRKLEADKKATEIFAA